MRRNKLHLRRWLFNCAGALSLVLCGATAALWARGYFVADVVSAAWVGSGSAPVAREVNARCEGGVLLLQAMSRPQPATAAGPPLLPNDLRWGYRRSRPRLDLPRFARRASPKAGGVDRWLTLPCWLLMLPAGAFGGWMLRGWLRTRRAARLGRCSRCGYDLRATPERCPECGQPVAKATPHNPPMQRTPTASSVAVE
jgi:hypothetical protein